MGRVLTFDFNDFLEVVKEGIPRHRIKMTVKRKRLLQTSLAERDETAAPVIKKMHRQGTAAGPIRGLYEVATGSPPRVVEYEPDTELRDTEQIPLQEEGGIEGFLRREVLPYAEDAWYVPKSVKIGYEISFNRYFYKPEPMRTLEEIRADILAVEKETTGFALRAHGSSAVTIPWNPVLSPDQGFRVPVARAGPRSLGGSPCQTGATP